MRKIALLIFLSVYGFSAFGEGPCQRLLLNKLHLVEAYREGRSELIEPHDQMQVFDQYGLGFEELEAGSFLVVPVQGEAQPGVAKLLQTLMLKYNLRFQSEVQPTNIDTYSAKWDASLGQHVMYLPLEFFMNSEAAYKKLKQLHNNLSTYLALRKQGALEWTAKTISSSMAFQILGNAKAPANHPLKWIFDAANNYQVDVYMSDDFFVGEMADADAFALDGTVYLRTATADLDSNLARLVVIHELEHAVNYRKCLQGEDCGREIKFSSKDIHLLTATPFAQDPSGFHEIYSSFFQSDEVEAYLVSARQAVKDGDVAVSRDQFDRVHRFRSIQLAYLESALKELERDPGLNRHIPLKFPGGTIELELPRSYKGTPYELISRRIKELESLNIE